MCLEEVVPKNRNPYMTDRVWGTYNALVWCCNSLDSYAGLFGYLSISESPIEISQNEAHSVWTYMTRAQEVIMALLEECGRLKEFDEWEKEAKNAKTQ